LSGGASTKPAGEPIDGDLQRERARDLTLLERGPSSAYWLCHKGAEDDCSPSRSHDAFLVMLEKKI